MSQEQRNKDEMNKKFKRRVRGIPIVDLKMVYFKQSNVNVT